MSGFSQVLDCHPSNRKNFDYLIRLMQRHVVIPFIGAGFSANFGYPGWSKFLEKQAKIQNLPQIYDALSQHKFEEAASILKNHLHGNAMEVLMIQEFGDQVYKTNLYPYSLNVLPALFRNLIITTNFDEVIELLYAKVNGEYIEKLTPQSLNDTRLLYKRIACGDPTLVKLHGDVASRKFVLTKDEYDKYYGEDILDVRLPLPSFLKDILLSKVILFIGCSLEDDRTLRIIEQARIDGSMSFALLPLPKSTNNSSNEWKPLITEELNGCEVENLDFQLRRQFLDKHNIIPIWYPYGQYQALELFLKELSYHTLSKYQLSATQLHQRLEQLLSEDSGANQRKLYEIYIETEEMIRYNNHIFSYDFKIDILKNIKRFYLVNGDIREHKEVIRDMIEITKHSKGNISLELFWRYHELSYTFERFYYYNLMLRALQQAQKILNQYKEEYKFIWEQDYQKKRELFNAKAALYTSIGYAYLKSEDVENAKKYYKMAEEIKDSEFIELAWKAFIYNGLYRYYMLLHEPKKALETLNIALNQRRILSENKDINMMQYIINTHSNKIRVYLDCNQIQYALNEYESCNNEPNIISELRKIPYTHQRILTDYGDILNAQGKYTDAVSYYHKALKIRNYLYLEDDIVTASLYKKIAKSLEHECEKLEEALEYSIQAYLIFENQLGENSSETKMIMQDIMVLINKLGYSDNVLNQRLSVQHIAREVRSNPHLQMLQDELIKYFGLT